jgi:hypothetical protein
MTTICDRTVFDPVFILAKDLSGLPTSQELATPRKRVVRDWARPNSSRSSPSG